MFVTSLGSMLLFSISSSCTLVEVKTISFSSSSITIGVSVLAISSREYSTCMSLVIAGLSFEPFVSSIVVNVAAVAVTVVAVVVESLVGLAKGRPALIQHDVGQRKIVSFTAKANEHVNGKCEEIQAGFSFA
ncbi:hypothetical protein Tco_0959613 [Tanacetum coccineum]